MERANIPVCVDSTRGCEEEGAACGKLAWCANLPDTKRTRTRTASNVCVGARYTIHMTRLAGSPQLDALGLLSISMFS